MSGWHRSTAVEWPQIARWHVSRFAASLTAGGMLALSGIFLQRVTGNPVASPELLGVSGGAMPGTLADALLFLGAIIRVDSTR